MLSNLHTHSSFCDGKNTPEEVVRAAIAQGFCSIGFSGHGYTAFDLRYCMKDADGYIAEIRRLKEAYKHEIQIYLGSEEDAFAPVNRANYEYIIGSSHYYCVDGKYYPIDSGYDYFSRCKEVFNGDIIRMAHAYYEPFCRYILERKPDIIGHFDLITKFDEMDESLYANNAEYHRLAEQYTLKAAASGSLFEVNTGAISRGYRTTPYPYENLLHRIRKHASGIILSADSHAADTIAFRFEDTRKYLKEIGFEHVFVLYNGEFVKDRL